MKIFISKVKAASLTQCPYEIVLGPQAEHGQVEVEDAQVKGLGGDIWVVDDTLHRTYAIEGKVDQQTKSTSAQLHQHVSLKQVAAFSLCTIHLNPNVHLNVKLKVVMELLGSEIYSILFCFSVSWVNIPDASFFVLCCRERTLICSSLNVTDKL